MRHAAASKGARSGGARLGGDLLDELGPAFDTDFSDVQIHHDDGAAEAMGAEAVARGNHIHVAAHRDPMDKELIGHELAHVVQQREGRASGPQGKNGEVGDDSLEAEADRAGSSIASGGLVPQESRAKTSHKVPRERVTQRKPSPKPTPSVSSSSSPSTSPPTPAPPPSRTATWDQISSAAADPKAREELDIEWIESLDSRVRDSIDRQYSDSGAEVRIRKHRDGDLRKIAATYTRDERTLRRSIAKRLKVPWSSRAIDKDPDYIEQHRILIETRDKDQASREGAIREGADEMSVGRMAQTVARPPTPKITRAEGKALSRTNFMSWAINVTGSAEAAKKQFQSIREVAGQPNMLLAASAAARFEAARADFEAKHTGYTFPNTSIAFALRGFHQQTQPVGMLGHALGVAFDFLAVDNPNLKDEHDSLGPNRLMLTRFGRDPKSPDKPGRAMMKLGRSDTAIEEMGKHTMAGTSTADDDAMIEKIRQQFGEMHATSERFKASLAPFMDKLREARDMYFERPRLEAKKKQLEKQLDPTTIKRAATRQVAREKFQGTRADQRQARQQRIDEVIAETSSRLQDELSATTRDLEDASPQKVTATLVKVFEQWTKTLETDALASDTKRTTSVQEVAATQEALSELPSIETDDLEDFANRCKLSPRNPRVRPARYRRQLASELRARLGRAKSAVQWAAGEAKAYRALETTFKNPALVFGRGIRGKDGHWSTKLQATSVSVMQYLEHGFVRSDEMPEVTDAPKGGKKHQVFNAEVATTLARFGWAPGATFGDTMHFDFVEGYTLAVPGGRANRSRFSPQGAPSPKQKAKP